MLDDLWIPAMIFTGFMVASLGWGLGQLVWDLIYLGASYLFGL